jgi:hypothetical protein
LEIENTGGAAVEVSSPDQGAAPEAPASVESTETEHATPEERADPEHPAYEPNFRFKAYDREGEIEEWARQYIKDKETEDRFRQLYAKSTGFDFLKDRYKSRSSEYNDLKTRYSDVETKAQQAEKAFDELRYLRDNDLHGFLEACKIPPDKLIDYVEKHLEFLGKSPQEQAEIKKVREDQQRLRQLEQQNQQFSQAQEQQALDTHKNEFWGYMEHPEVQGFAENFDARAGREGAFAQAVIQHGDLHFRATGETLKPLEAIRAVYKQYKGFIGGESAQTRPRHPNGQYAPSRDESHREGAEGGPPEKRPPVIPNVGRGTTASPTKRVFKTLDDLKKHAAALAAED